MQVQNGEACLIASETTHCFLMTRPAPTHPPDLTSSQPSYIPENISPPPQHSNISAGAPMEAQRWPALNRSCQVAKTTLISCHSFCSVPVIVPGVHCTCRPLSSSSSSISSSSPLPRTARLASRYTQGDKYTKASRIRLERLSRRNQNNAECTRPVISQLCRAATAIASTLRG